MIKVGLSGKIASGKSEIEKMLQNMGYLVFDLDKISHSLFDDEPIKNKILNTFKTLDRKEIGKIVFNDNTRKEKLEEIIYPKLKEIIFELFEKYKEEKAIFISGALLFKSGFYKFFDKTIFIEADDEIRLKRLIKRNNLELTEAKARLNLQDDKTFADFIIENNKDKEKLNNELNKVLKTLFNQ